MAENIKTFKSVTIYLLIILLISSSLSFQTKHLANLNVHIPIYNRHALYIRKYVGLLKFCLFHK